MTQGAHKVTSKRKKFTNLDQFLKYSQKEDRELVIVIVIETHRRAKKWRWERSPLEQSMQLNAFFFLPLVMSAVPLGKIQDPAVQSTSSLGPEP